MIITVNNKGEVLQSKELLGLLSIKDIQIDLNGTLYLSGFSNAGGLKSIAFTVKNGHVEGTPNIE